ncbi:hypothetical protein LCGC14_1261920 [marine sediment metagenome]|uniref:PA14 domain-containing protein n=1 Tax=marine sediment metagenome TaxID=412755 RepID=A0A0F9NH50_9ZZZZ
MYTKGKVINLAIVGFAFGPIFMVAQESKNLGIEHVIVIGFDGLSPDGLHNSNTPIFDSLKNEGAYTMHARAILPTSSSPNWASMIMGAGPEQHGITSNAWERDNFTLPAITQGDDFLFPTIFRLLDEQKKDVEIGIVYDWDGFGRLFEKSAVDYDINPENEDETAIVASNYIIDKKPDLTFLHFDHVDHAGHEFGHGTEEYYTSVEKADELLGKVIEAIKKAGILDSSMVIISSDHGGLGKGHGGETLQEIEIPFILWGKSVKKNHKIEHPVYQYDNAATVAYALGLKAPNAWIGKPVKSAFIGYEAKDGYPILEQSEPPIILPKSKGYKKAGGLFDDSTLVSIKNPTEDGIVRYTLNGSMPSSDSPIAEGLISLDKNTVVKSAIFKEDKIRSEVAEAYFRIKSKNTIKPVNYEIFYLKDLRFIPALDNRKPDVTGSCYEITSAEIENLIKGNTAVRFKSQIIIEQSGMYQFYTRSDDGSKLFVDDQLVVDNDGDHGVREKEGQIHLKPGAHHLEVVWFNGGGDGWLDVYVETDKMPKQIVSTTLLRTK